jgi:hypothetical protein
MPMPIKLLQEKFVDQMNHHVHIQCTMQKNSNAISDAFLSFFLSFFPSFFLSSHLHLIEFKTSDVVVVSLQEIVQLQRHRFDLDTGDASFDIKHTDSLGADQERGLLACGNWHFRIDDDTLLGKFAVSQKKKSLQMSTERES